MTSRCCWLIHAATATTRNCSACGSCHIPGEGSRGRVQHYPFLKDSFHTELPQLSFGTSYHGVLFRFQRRDGGALGLLWTQEDGQCKLVSYQVFEMCNTAKRECQ